MSFRSKTPPKNKSRQILYGGEQSRELLIGPCYDYLCKIGIHWFNAMEIVGRYPIDEIRIAVLTLRDNNVNVAHRHRELLVLLKGKEHEIWRK